ncbi:MAG: hypothetical protein AB1509_02240 [Chloroflexota bacterium]
MTTKNSREAAPLGKNTRFASALHRIDNYTQLSPEEKAAQNRLVKWQRQSMAARIMHDQRVAKCFRNRVKPFVEVLYSPKVRKAHYGGLMICGSVWMCPVCAAKITEKRRLELEGVNTSGLSCFMVTLTLQHTRDDRLRTVQHHLAEAWRKMKSGRWWQKFQSEFLIVGSVTGTEVTYGLEAGWHPHKHVLVWSRLSFDEIDSDVIRKRISARFEYILAKMGRYVSPIHGVDVRKGNDLIREYVAKFGHEPKDAGWSLAAEITKAPAKIGLRYGDHYTMFQLLDLYMAGSMEAGKLFREYALTMKGTKQLVWSRYTRELLGLGQEISDEELAAMQEQDASILALLKPEHWRVILRNEKRSALLEVANTGKVEYLRVFLEGLGISLDAE